MHARVLQLPLIPVLCGDPAQGRTVLGALTALAALFPGVLLVGLKG